jgi:DNA-binding transcriptional regulator YdaS (Cro superfamily)
VRLASPKLRPMKLSEYIKAQRGNGAALAKKLNISPSIVSQIANNSEGTSPARGVAIEMATAGAVTRKDLRPDWKQIWPELAHPCCKAKAKKARS